MVRPQILFKNVISPTFAAIIFWFCGYVFAFGGNGVGGFMGSTDGWFLATGNMFEPSGAGMPYNSGELASWFFQWAFAATASTIVSGAVAERINFQVYIVITVCLTGFIYPVVVHWQWGGGWAGAWGVLDFAGSGVVHMTGGVAALVAVWYVGPRHGRFCTQYRHPVGEAGTWYRLRQKFLHDTHRSQSTLWID
jgi:Amt family ammonium transporter